MPKTRDADLDALAAAARTVSRCARKAAKLRGAMAKPADALDAAQREHQAVVDRMRFGHAAPPQGGA